MGKVFAVFLGPPNMLLPPEFFPINHYMAQSGLATRWYGIKTKQANEQVNEQAKEQTSVYKEAFSEEKCAEFLSWRSQEWVWPSTGQGWLCMVYGNSAFSTKVSMEGRNYTCGHSWRQKKKRMLGEPLLDETKTLSRPVFCSQSGQLDAPMGGFQAG